MLACWTSQEIPGYVSTIVLYEYYTVLTATGVVILSTWNNWRKLQVWPERKCECCPLTCYGSWYLGSLCCLLLISFPLCIVSTQTWLLQTSKLQKQTRKCSANIKYLILPTWFILLVFYIYFIYLFNKLFQLIYPVCLRLYLTNTKT